MTAPCSRYAQSVQHNSGHLLLSGVLARADCLTANARLYPLHVLQATASQLADRLRTDASVLGELEHPAYTCSTYRHLHPVAISHKVLAVWWRGKDLLGLIEVLPTPAGKLVQELYAAGGAVGASIRGWSSFTAHACDPSGSKVQMVIQEVELIAVDLTCLPASDCYLRPVESTISKHMIGK